MPKPVVSVRLMVYNNEPYIKEAIEGILMQKTNFLVEVVVGDDFSDDRTLSIIKEYKNTDNIYFNILEREVGGKYWTDRKKLGRLYNFKNIIDNCSGKYIALLDGDDYWTDPFKLQKQVNFLEKNQKYGICGHVVTELNDFSENNVFPQIDSNKDYSLEDYIINNYTASCSLIFNKKYLRFLKDYFLKLPFGDLSVILTVLKNSNNKIKVLSDNMGIYRLHEGSIHGKLKKDNHRLISAYMQHIVFFKGVKKVLLTDEIYNKSIQKKITNTYSILSNLAKNENLLFLYIKFKLKKKYSMFHMKFL